LYPLLGISPSEKIKPESSHIAMDNYIFKEDMKLICIYNTSTLNFVDFSKKVLKSKKNYVEEIKIDDIFSAYIFDYSMHKSTWYAFLNAKYSQFEDNSKKTILNYFNNNKANVLYITSYLYPEKYFQDYARILGVDVQFLKEVGELCSKPDFEIEQLKIDSLIAS
jgi:hypothetical protein